jgi:endoglucanase
MALKAGIVAFATVGEGIAAPPTPVERFGRLQASGNRILGEDGQPAQLRGMSFFWSMWMDKYWNEDAVEWLAEDWQADVLRAAMGVDEAGGYLKPADWLPDSKAFNMNLMETVVNASLDQGIYVIVDWHSHNAQLYTEDAKDFFSEMAQRYGHHPNVIFELFNEPTSLDWSSEVKPYHEAVLASIRKHSTNLVILGTPTWSQDVDVACEDPVADENVAYTLHFYAASHNEPLRQKAQTALDNGCALFVTEWGTCKATGNGTLDFDETQRWLDWMDERSISSANWALSDKMESCSAFQPGAAANGKWSPSISGDLTWSGLRVRNYLSHGDAISCDGEGWPCVAPPCSDPNDECSDTRCCSDAGYTCYAKDHWWAQCMTSCGGDGQEDWSCDELVPTTTPVAFTV